MNAQSTRPTSLKEDDLGTQPAGPIVKKYHDGLPNESAGFKMPDRDALNEGARRELEYMSTDPAADQFDFKKGPFVVDLEP